MSAFLTFRYAHYTTLSCILKRGVGLSISYRKQNWRCGSWKNTASQPIFTEIKKYFRIVDSKWDFLLQMANFPWYWIRTDFKTRTRKSKTEKNNDKTACFQKKNNSFHALKWNPTLLTNKGTSEGRKYPDVGIFKKCGNSCTWGANIIFFKLKCQQTTRWQWMRVLWWWTPRKSQPWHSIIAYMCIDGPLFLTEPLFRCFWYDVDLV